MSILPVSGPSGTLVTINGTLFGDPQGTSLVYFQPANGPPVSAGPASLWTDSQIQVHVPAGLPSEMVSLFVDKGGVLSNPMSFTVTGALPGVPQITAITPTSGNPLTEVVISGSGFGNIEGTVLFGGSPGPVESWTDTEIRVFPPNFAGSSTLQVQVANGAGAGNGVSFDYLAQYSASIWVPGLTSPWAIAMDQSAWGIFVAYGSATYEIKKYDTTTQNTLIGSWTTISGSGNCYGLAVEPSSGNLFFSTANAAPYKIVEYNSGGTAQVGYGLLQQSPPESGAYGAGVALDSSGGVWVCDQTNGAVEKYTWDGSNFVIANQATDWLLGFSTSPNGGPFGVAADNRPGAGYIYITDTSMNEVEKYLANGTFMGTLISGANAPAVPRAITVAESGHILVTQTTAADLRIKIYEPDGSLVKEIPMDPSWFWMSLGGIAVDKLGNIYAVHTGGAVWKLTPSASASWPIPVRQRR
ncbi:MAG: IPT/TIG domain-containing protein [Armatimonadetes bacterium]|nr:IPT/TIG domain-containing protein [Armatimonadota bacterium]